ncbi:EcsC family protein [Weissella diestrammenae]|uniref:EcsC family protein n=1 Tax=Weissella diestrammenae TaxID=1162633 RepID=A0A7G9T3L5_9LACO|nr:EcsC family protein [Weissella diestrammenae]MCM0582665.1 EcsC family protein [Weissella diestrammenae]QNN74690.1 EcsC family protein [Weissella diestrammenae]
MSRIDDLGAKVKSLSSKTGQISEETMSQALDWAYDKTLNGIPGQKSIDDLIDDYLSKYDKETAIDKLISYQTTKAAVSGFVTGFGGVITMPVTIPANITTVILFQMRMIAAIAKIRGYNLNSDQVQTFVYATLAGTSVADMMKKSGIVIGNKLAINVVKKIPGKTLTKINQAVGFRLATKFGTKGVVNLGKMVPVLGAGIGGVFDMTTTRTIAKYAKQTFTESGIDLGDGTIISQGENDMITLNPTIDEA